jgi:DNA-binding response OmpR family regulator
MKKKVLVVEDDAEMANMLHAVLSDSFQVTVCTDKVHALNRAKQYLKEHGPPDAVIIDIIINGEGGLDFYRWMHMSGYFPPVIFLTGCHEQSPEFVAAVETGEKVYAKDHFSSSKLVQFLTELVSRKAS